MTLEQSLVISYLSDGSALLPIVIGFLLLQKKNSDRVLLYLWLLTITAFLLDISSVLIVLGDNLFGNIYRLAEFHFLLVSYFFAFGRKTLKLFITIAIVYTSFFFVDLIFLQAKQLTSFSVTLTAAVFIIFSVLHFFKLMRDLPSTHIHQLPMFWVDTAVLVYFAGAFFIFLLRNYLIEVLKDDQIVYWSLHNILNIIKNILFAIGLWHATKSPVVKSETR
ncbi:MAG: hypothetical protein JSS79_01230 [Bacteroidetes bacterium]|nr:hypothetical protein [Bacteroidota bacterium]